MNILYIAYSCSPNHGSEDRIGWKIPVTSSKSNKVYVITKEEHRKVIGDYLSENNDLDIKFYYVDIPKIYKKLYKGALYAGRLNIWQKRAEKLAKEICENEKIDVIHQVTPVEFRSIGDYGSVPDIKFVCGPVGGGEYIPKGLKCYAKNYILEEALRLVANKFSRFALSKKGAFSRIDAIMYANEETKDYLKKVVNKKSSYHECVTEIGIDNNEITKKDDFSVKNKPTFIVAGRLVYRKGIELLLDALSKLDDTLDYECHIVGNGPQFSKLNSKCEKLGLSKKVFFKGRIPFDKMSELYENADALILPSIRETTGSVILEAMSKGLAVITINKYGGAVLVNEQNGYLYGGESKAEYINNLKNTIENCIKNPDELMKKKENALVYCKKYEWNKKISNFNAIYNQIIIDKK